MKIQHDPIKFIAPDYEYNVLEEWGEQYKTDSAIEEKKTRASTVTCNTVC